MGAGDFAAIVQAAGSVILLVVTGWYAWLTKGLAESARLSAASAAEAAEAYRTSLSAQLAIVPITFRFDPVPPRGSRNAKLPLNGIHVIPTGASLWLHSVHIEDVGKRFGGEYKWLGMSAEVTSSREAAIKGPEFVQPGETWQGVVLPFAGTDPEIGLPRSELVALKIKIVYSLDRDGPQLGKTFEWRDETRPHASPPGRDASQETASHH